jgi:hypothetical protein
VTSTSPRSASTGRRPPLSSQLWSTSPKTKGLLATLCSQAQEKLDGTKPPRKTTSAHRPTRLPPRGSPERKRQQSKRSSPTSKVLLPPRSNHVQSRILKRRSSLSSRALFPRNRSSPPMSALLPNNVMPTFRSPRSHQRRGSTTGLLPQ